MIRFENVTFSYSGKAEPSLSHCSFQIKPGELILLCGVSGCGKISYKVNSGEAGRGGGLGRKVNPDGGGREGALGRDGKNEVIHDISLRIEPGQTVAFVGPSGGGKSTLASLVSRFFDPQGGSVRIGGADVRDIPKGELMDTVSFVFQNSRLIKASILDNVRMGKPDASESEVLTALEAGRPEPVAGQLLIRGTVSNARNCKETSNENSCVGRGLFGGRAGAEKTKRLCTLC